MHKLEKRLRKIEAATDAPRLHVLMWSEGLKFDDVIKRNPGRHDANQRVLIHLKGVKPGQPSGVVPVSPEHAGEYAKAQAWAKGEDWEALP
tara:strand:+ start:3675 stop:3947 length:273 start_codon:yes stop_codon:yes gene_type:complete